MKPISKTAFYCCGVRMQDAESDTPVCGDVYARRFMDEDGLRLFEAFRGETGANAANVARPRIIDDLLREELGANPHLTVILIGAGFDSRAFRLTGGTWIELDEPQVIAYKNERLPVEGCPNEIRRVAIDFATDSLAEKLAPFAGAASPVVFVVEGVFVYLDEETIARLLETLRRLFPEHKLIGDLMNRRFFEEYGRTLQEKINGVGAAFKFTVDEPEELFRRNGYDRAEKISIVGSAVDYGLLPIPKAALETQMKTLAEGNAIYVFESAGGHS